MSSNDSQRELGRLTRALPAVLSPMAQDAVARGIAALGTTEAYERLIGEIVERGIAEDACRIALREVGEAAMPHIRQALLTNTDCAGLVVSLPDEIDQETADALITACRKTTDPSVVRWATEAVVDSVPEKTEELIETIRRRQSEVLTAAANIGVIAARPGQLLDQLEQYLDEEAGEQVQDMALTVPEALELEQGRQLIRRGFASSRVADRRQALEAVADYHLEEFAEVALNRWVTDPSRIVRGQAWQALCAIQSVMADKIPGLSQQICEQFSEAAGSVVTLLSKPGETEVELLKQTVDRTCELMSQLRRLQSAAWLARSYEGELCVEILRAVRPAVPQLVGLGGDDTSRRIVYPLAEQLLQLQVAIAQIMWNRGDGQARLAAWELAGFNTITLVDEPEPLRGPLPEVEWEEIVQQAEDLSAQIVWRWEAQVQGQPPPHALLPQWPLVGRYVTRSAFLDRIFVAAQVIPNVEQKAVVALQASLEQETEIGVRIGNQIGPEKLMITQITYNGQALAMLQPEISVREELSARQQRGEADRELSLSPAAPIFLEQNVQLALLGIMALSLSRKSVDVLIECLESPNALVVESAEHLLARLGGEVVGELKAAAREASEEPLKALLLEVGRSISASEVVDLARDSLASDSPPLCAVAVKTIGEAGSLADAAAIRERFGQVDELVDVCVLQALAALDADGYAGVFAEALGSLYPGTRWAAWNGLRYCSSEVIDEYLAHLSESANAFQRLAARSIKEADGAMEPLGWSFTGKVFPAAGDWNLGARMATDTHWPWEWGLPLLLRDPGLAPDSYKEVIASDDDLADYWHRYSRSGSVEGELLVRLREIALGEESQLAEQAWQALFDLLGSDMECAVAAFSPYHRVKATDQMKSRVKAACRQAIRDCSPEVVASLDAPNPSPSSPLAEAFGVPMSTADTAFRFQYAFVLRLTDILPEMTGVADKAVSLPGQPEGRQQTIETEWDILMVLQTPLYGFWVKPRLDLDDLVWYTQQLEGDETIKQEMINYLAAAATVLPQFPDQRAQTIEALRDIFQPLIRQTNSQLCDVVGERYQAAEIEGWVESEFAVAVREFDALWANQPAAFLPFGTVADMTQPAPKSPRRRASDLPDRYVPFSHFLERRLTSLIDRTKADQSSQAAVGPTDQEDFPGVRDDERETVYRAREEQLLDGILKGQPLADLEDIFTPTVPAEAHNTITLEIDGESISCVDIKTLAQKLGTTAGALRERERTGGVEFIRHKGRRYYPADDIANVAAQIISNRQLAKRLGVSRNTIRRWKKEAPAELEPHQVLQYLARRADNQGRWPEQQGEWEDD